MSVDMAAAEFALSKAKIQLMDTPDTAFYTTIVFSLKFSWDMTIPTAATDGVHLWINPVFWLSLTPGLRKSVLVHEAMHVAYDHMGRMLERKMPEWNYAADYVDNLQIKDAGFEVGENWLCDEQYRGMHAEDVYELIIKNPPPPPPSSGGTGATGGLGEDIKPSPLTGKEHERHINDVLIRARIQSRKAGDKAGSIPGDIELFLDKLLNPVLPWNRIMQKWLQKFDKSDWSFKKPSRRFFPRFHMPSLVGNGKLIDLAIGADISGSVSVHDFTVMVSEIYSVLKMFKPDKITLIQFDTEIHHIDVIRDIRDLMKVKFHGRGGTDVNPLLEWAEKNKPEGLLIFTDGGLYNHEYSSTRDVVWLIHNNPGFESHVGKVIHYQIKK